MRNAPLPSPPTYCLALETGAVQRTNHPGRPRRPIRLPGGSVERRQNAVITSKDIDNKYKVINVC